MTSPRMRHDMQRYPCQPAYKHKRITAVIHRWNLYNRNPVFCTVKHSGQTSGRLPLDIRESDSLIQVPCNTRE